MSYGDDDYTGDIDSAARDAYQRGRDEWDGDDRPTAEDCAELMLPRPMTDTEFDAFMAAHGPRMLPADGEG